MEPKEQDMLLLERKVTGVGPEWCHKKYDGVFG